MITTAQTQISATYFSSVSEIPGGRVTHPHDCDCCAFAGTFWDLPGDDRVYDVYVCGGRPTDGNETDITLLARFGEYGDYHSFPAAIARLVAQQEEASELWRTVVHLYDLWRAAGCPDTDLRFLKDKEFLENFRPGFCTNKPSDDGEWGVYTTPVSLSHRVTKDNVDLYVRSRFPATHCQHEHDCCGNTYLRTASWEYMPGTEDRMILVTQSWAVNI